MTSTDAEKMIEKFLDTLDKFSITSFKPNDMNYVQTGDVYRYWTNKGVINDEHEDMQKMSNI